MYPTLQEKAIVDAAEQIMIETMARYDPSHDKYHVQRVRKTALTLAKSINPTPDLLIVELAALLHDVLDKKYVSAEEAADPFTFFLPFFQRMAAEHGIDLVSDGRGQTIARVIDNVSWSTEKKLREAGKWTAWHDSCVELHCVQDADRLDAIGAFGIMRCASYSTVTNRPLHTPPDDPEHKYTSIQHFHDKLLHIRDRLKTGPGRKLGDRRHQVVSSPAGITNLSPFAVVLVLIKGHALFFDSTAPRSSPPTQLLDFLASVEEEYQGTVL